MKTVFPDIDDGTNTVFAWGGLGETSGWVAKSGIEQNHIIGINSSHKTGTASQKVCP